MNKGFTHSRETIWHISCQTCGFYWTYPTMKINETPENRTWYCPLCGQKGTSEEQKDIHDTQS
ncbi:MAG: hypothetical protein ISQ21_04685 [Alphaproteobacteria bacterium]|nr:hypothetical protein [Alphaproteobacteria bacterium]